jgi:hypothetical protein
MQKKNQVILTLWVSFFLIFGFLTCFSPQVKNRKKMCYQNKLLRVLANFFYHLLWLLDHLIYFIFKYVHTLIWVQFPGLAYLFKKFNFSDLWLFSMTCSAIAESCGWFNLWWSLCSLCLNLIFLLVCNDITSIYCVSPHFYNSKS